MKIIKNTALTTLATTSAIALGLLGSSASAASYDCNADNLTGNEVTICDDPQLSAMDSQMADLYNQLMANGSEQFDEEQKQEQEQWLQEREACGTDTSCIYDAYTRRINELEKYD